MSSVEYFSDRKVLVTGAGGFIGGALCSRLGLKGAQVIGAGRSSVPPGFSGQWIQCDLTDRSSARSLVGSVKADLVFHLAGRTLGEQGRQAVWPNLQDNFLATINVLVELAEKQCGRIVVLGSLREPDTELEPTPLSPYAASKFAATTYARMFHRLYGLQIVIARLFMVYGPGRQDMKKLIPYVADQLAMNREAQISTGDTAFDFVFIDDAVAGLLALAESPDLEGRTLDIGSGQLATIGDVARGIAQRLGKAHLLKLGVIPDRRFEPMRVADTEQTASLTGWHANVPLSEGLDRFLIWHTAKRTSQAAVLHRSSAVATKPGAAPLFNCST